MKHSILFPPSSWLFTGPYHVTWTRAGGLLVLLLVLVLIGGSASSVRAAGMGPTSGQMYSSLSTSGISDFGNDVTQLFAGGDHTCVLTTGGGVRCWGRNADGELGDGTTTMRTSPVDVLASPGGPPLTGVASLGVGYHHTCVLMTNGGVKCWGFGANGRLGDGNTLNRSTPVDVVTSIGGPPLTGVVAISAGGTFTCALMTGGGVKCWGPNYYGQLGNGTTAPIQATPVDVLTSPGGPLLTGVSNIVVGGEYGCALMMSGGVKCWGYNSNGQLGDGTTVQRTTPVDVSGLPGGVTAIASGYYHACVLTTGGGVKCWGRNANGQLGNNTTTNSLTPVDVWSGAGNSAPLTGVSEIKAGTYHTCALVDSDIKCWGGNPNGQLGDGTTTDQLTPVDVLVSPGGALLGGVMTISTQGHHTCARTTSGVMCWGRNNNGQLGDGTTTDQTSPVNVHGLETGATAIAAGLGHTCAVTASGGVKCWGANADGRLGDGTTTSRTTPVDVLVSPGGAPLNGVTAIAVEQTHSCALTEGGGVKCWGYNENGQLGNGTTIQQTIPVDVLVSPGGDPLSGVMAIAVGSSHTCALTEGGGVKCWGYNGEGELGDGTTTQQTTPVDVLVSPGGDPLSGVMAIAVGSSHTCALMPGGGVKCWGYNDTGQLGDGTRINRYNPVDVLVSPGGVPLSGVTAIGAGGNHACAVTTSGGVKCWGRNYYGQLGDGTVLDRYSPVDVLESPGGDPLGGVADISAGQHHTCALTTSGGVKCWGFNGFAQLGDGTTAQRNTPVVVSELTGGAAAITAGYAHTCALTTSGGVECWGQNDYGQIGDGTSLQKTIPAQVSGFLSACTTAVVSSLNPMVAGQSTILVATVSGPVTTPTGTVQFKLDGANLGGSVMLTNGKAMSSAVGNLASGTHLIAAIYNGNTHYATSTAPAVAQVVNRANTTTALATSGSPSLYGAPVTFTATVNPSPANALLPTGTVTFYEVTGSGASAGMTEKARVKTAAGQGAKAPATTATFTWTTSTLSPGTHTIVAKYNGDDNFTSSSSSPLTQTVNGRLLAITGGNNQNAPRNAAFATPLQVTLTNSDGSPVNGMSVTFTASAAGNGASAVLSSSSATTNASGVASVTATANDQAGAYTVMATVDGAIPVSFALSNSKADTTTLVTSDVNPSTFGEVVTLTAHVNPVAPGSGTPTGSVVFYEVTGSAPGAVRTEKVRVPLTQVAGPSGPAAEATSTWATSTLAFGNHSIVAVYSGDGAFSGSNSAPYVQTVTNRVVENNSPKIQYNGWVAKTDTSASGGSYRMSKTLNDTVTFRFMGTSVTWVTYTGPDQGQASVTIDGVLKGTVNNYASAGHWKVSQTYAGLASQAHTLVIKLLAAKNLVVDAFKVNGATLVEDTDLKVQYNGWLGASIANASGGNYRVGSTVGTKAFLTFTGLRVEWVTVKCKTCGKASVYIDGALVKTVDLYAATTQWKVVIPFALTTAGPHKMEIRVLGTKNASATGTNVYLDAFQGPFKVP